MSEPYATVSDISTLWRPLTAEETTRAEALLPLVSDMLRQCASDVGKDMDQMVDDMPAYGGTVKAVTVDVVARVLRQSTSGEPMTQESQAALNYSWSGTYAIPGGGISQAIMYNDLKRLGLRRQRYGAVEMWRYDTGNDGNANSGDADGS